MDLDELLLKKEELPFLRGYFFQVPIHPDLLREGIQISEDLAYTLLEKVTDEWHQDLKKSPSIGEKGKSGWNIDYFLREPHIEIKENGKIVVQPIGWEPDAFISESGTGFAYSLMVERNSAGSLYFNESCADQILGPPYIKMSDKKLEEYCVDEIHKGQNATFGRGNLFRSHNLVHLPGSLFLRNWAIAYLNSALTHIRK